MTTLARARGRSCKTRWRNTAGGCATQWGAAANGAFARVLQGKAPFQVKCPNCGVLLVLRHRKEGGQPFLGCKNFPRCRHITKLDHKTYLPYRGGKQETA